MPSTELPLGFLLADAQRLWRRRFDRAAVAAGLGLTAGEARTLAYVANFGGLRQTALAERMNVEPMTLVGFLDALEARGLVAREPDPNDRRAKLVRMTAAAEPVVAAIRVVGAAMRAEATRGLSDADVAAFRRSLAAITANLAESEAVAA
jgi:MarR family transcriptional regulator for hemolysin